MPLLQKSGVDTHQLYQILRIKLMMDNRRPSTLFATKRKADPTKPPTPWAASIGTLIMGGLIGMALFFFKMPMIGQTIYFGFFMVLMSLTLITDFTTVLLDVRDQFILLPRPVSDRTLALSRILHISIYIFRLALLQGLGGLIIIGFVDGIAAIPLFLVQLFLATFMSILFVNIVYLLLMRSVSPQKFKDIISYFQIGFSVFIFAIYYLVPRLVDLTVLSRIDLLHYKWTFILPPVWITALNEVLIHPSRANLTSSLLAIAGITAPLAGLWLVAKVLAPGFNKRLAVAATSDGNTDAPKVKTEKPRFNFVNKLANLVAPNPVENAGFRITWKLAARIREFKIKVYPAFAYVPIYFVYFALNGKGDATQRIFSLKNGQGYILLIYLSTFLISTVLQHISFTEKFKPAWVYYALPITQPGKILAGMYKAVITLYYLPYCIIIGLVSVMVWGPKVIDDVVLATIAGMIYGILMALYFVKGLPFSKPVMVKASGGRVFVSLIIMSVIGFIGFGHYILIKYHWDKAVLVLIIPALIIYLIMMRYYKRQSWESIELDEF